MALTDGDVAALARQAVDLLDPEIEIAIDPDDPVDPYRFGANAWTVWPLLERRRSFGIHVTSGMTSAEALARLIDALSDEAAESTRFWGGAFPACSAGHQHPARVERDGDAVVLRCPQTGAEVGRVVPDS